VADVVRRAAGQRLGPPHALRGQRGPAGGRPRRRPGRDAGPARAERRGQDDARRDPRGPPAPHGRGRRGARTRPRTRRRPLAGAHRRRPPGGRRPRHGLGTAAAAIRGRALLLAVGGGRPARADRPRGHSLVPGRNALRRPATTARCRARARRPAGAAVSRRADDRLRRGGAARGVGAARRREGRRHDDPADDARPLRGRASRRPDRHPRARPHPATGTAEELAAAAPAGGRGRSPLEDAYLHLVAEGSE
jgi:hypothetical protein